MKERPILFNGAMVRAVLSGQKTQTRRIAKVPAGHGVGWVTTNGVQSDWLLRDEDGDDMDVPLVCPFGAPGDRLYVRETWAAHPLDEAEPPQRILYQADGANYDAGAVTSLKRGPKHLDYPDWRPKHWRPSIHMPRWASRTLLDVTEVRIERLQAISEDDAQREGVERPVIYDPSEELGARVHPYTGAYRDAFRELWGSVYGRESWEANPLVWVVSFKRVEAKAVAA